MDPASGLVCRNKAFNEWKRSWKRRKVSERSEAEERRRVIDERTQFLRLDWLWFEIIVDRLPAMTVAVRLLDLDLAASRPK